MKTFLKGWTIVAERTESWNSSFTGTHLSISRLLNNGEREFLRCSWFNGTVREAYKYGKKLVDDHEAPIELKASADHERFQKIAWRFDGDTLYLREQNTGQWLPAVGQLREDHDKWRASHRFTSRLTEYYP